MQVVRFPEVLQSDFPEVLQSDFRGASQSPGAISFYFTAE